MIRQLIFFSQESGEFESKLISPLFTKKMMEVY